MIRINLLPVRVSKKKEAGKQQLLLFVLALLFVLVCNFVWNRSRASELATREDKLKRTKAELAQLDKIIGEVKNIKEQQAAVKDKLAVLEKLKAARQGPVRALDELAGLVPKRLWLRKLDERAGSVTLEGSAGTIEDVSGLLAALKKSTFFSKPELKKTNARNDKSQKLVDFVIVAAVNYTPSLQATASAAPGPAGKP